MGKAARVRRTRKIRRRNKRGQPARHKLVGGRTGSLHYKKLKSRRGKK